MTGYVDLPIGNQTNDIVYEDGKIVWAKGDDEIMQRVRTRLRRIFGEWFLYYSAGIPYLEGRMLGSNDYDYAKLTIRQEIINTIGVVACNNINLIINPATKKVYIYAEITINSNIYKLNEEL